MSKIILICLFAIYSITAKAMKVTRNGSTQNVAKKVGFLACLAGGGADGGWAGGWKVMLEGIKGGDVLIIRTDGKVGAYSKWIYEDPEKLGLPHVNSVTTLIIENAQDSNSRKAMELVSHAAMIFFAGGDQSLYVDWIDNSAIQKIIQDRLRARNLVIGGTSAGMAYLAGIVFAAHYDSPRGSDLNVDSGDVMRDPTGIFVDMVKGQLGLPWLNHVITETHFTERERQGRVMGFMAKSFFSRMVSSPLDTRAIAADQGTAFCYGGNGIGQVYGEGTVYFLEGHGSIERVEPNNSLNWYDNEQGVLTYAIPASAKGSFDLKSWRGHGGSYDLWWVDGRAEKTPLFGHKNH